MRTFGDQTRAMRNLAPTAGRHSLDRQARHDVKANQWRDPPAGYLLENADREGGRFVVRQSRVAEGNEQLGEVAARIGGHVAYRFFEPPNRWQDDSIAGKDKPRERLVALLCRHQVLVDEHLQKREGRKGRRAGVAKRIPPQSHVIGVECSAGLGGERHGIKRTMAQQFVASILDGRSG